MANKLAYIFILSLLFMVNAIWAQCDYAKYHELTTTARKENAAENYKIAAGQLKLAFASVDFPFGTDLHLALKIADKTNDSAWLEEISIQLAKGGIPLKFFKKYEKQKWHAQFVKRYAEYAAYHNQNFNSNLKEKLISLALFDKEANARFHEWRTRKVEHSTDSIIKDAKRVAAGFESLVNEYGFPSEKKTGYYYNKSKVDELPTLVLLIHTYQRGMLLYESTLDELVCNGSITANDAQNLKRSRGLGNSNGAEQEMAAREIKYRPEKHQITKNAKP